MLKLIWTVQAPSVHSLKMNQAMAALMTLSWQFKELRVLLVKFITTFLPCRELISCLSECCNCYELRYVRDMMVSIVKRKVKQSVGPLVERKGGSNLKDNILKDVYNLYSFGEGSVQSLPKNMIKCDTKYVNQSTETDACLSNTIFASKLDLDTLNDGY